MVTMTRPPFINPSQSSEEIFHDRRSKKNGADAPTSERRSRQQFDAIPWWLKVNYGKGFEQKTVQSEDAPKKANK